MGPLSRRLAWAVAAGGLCLAATGARAHLVHGTPTLLRLVAGSDLVVRARVLDTDAALVLDGGALRRPLVRARVLEVLKGDPAAATDARAADPAARTESQAADPAERTETPRDDATERTETPRDDATERTETPRDDATERTETPRDDATERTETPRDDATPAAEAADAAQGGGAVGSTLRFAQHGHGVAPFEAGEETLLFLRRIERSRELGHVAGASDLRFVSVQEHDAHYVLDGDTGPALLAAARAYAGLAALPRSDDRRAAMRRITLALLGSEDPRLARSALRDWVMAGDAPLLREEDAAALDALVADPARDIGVRVGVLAELDRRGWVEGPPRWTALLGVTRGADRLAVVRAAGAHPSPPVTEALVALLGDDDAVLAATAAIALGAPGNDAAVAPLVAAAGDPRARLRGAALRGLGNVGTPAARAALAGLAASHEDPDTRRRAAAALRVLEATGPGGSQAPRPDAEIDRGAARAREGEPGGGEARTRATR